MPSRSGSLVSAVLSLACAVDIASAATPADQLARYAQHAGTPPQPQRGRELFVERHGREWSCASCHGNPPTGGGRHAGTGKPIDALAPAFNPARFADAAKSEKWFRRNCNDVLGRECSSAEKADVLAWLLTLRPTAGAAQ